MSGRRWGFASCLPVVALPSRHHSVLAWRTYSKRLHLPESHRHRPYPTEFLPLLVGLIGIRSFLFSGAFHPRFAAGREVRWEYYCFAQAVVGRRLHPRCRLHRRRTHPRGLGPHVVVGARKKMLESGKRGVASWGWGAFREVRSWEC